MFLFLFFSHDFNDNEKVQPLLLFAHYLALLARKSHQTFTCSRSTTKIFLVSLLLTLNKFHTLFQHVIASWVMFISQETASIQNPR